MSKEYRIESSRLPLSYVGALSHPAVRGVYLEELPYSVSGTSEISSEEYSVIEDGLMNVDGISDISCPFTHSYAAYIYILESGTYRFYVRSNFGAEATIYDGERGVSTGVTCGAQAESSSVEEITFARRGYYKVEVKYYSTGEASPVLELHFGESYIDFAVENLEKLEEGWNKNSKSSVRSEISKAKDLLMVLPLESISDRFAHKETVIASIQKALSPFEDVDSVFENTDLVIKLYKEFKQDPFLVSLSLAQKVSPKPLTPFMTFYHDAYEAVLSATTNIQLYSDLALDNFRRAIDDLSNLNNSCACSEAIGEFWGGHNDKCKRKLI